MGNRDINQSYNEVLPRASRYVVSRRPSRLTDVRGQLDGLTASDVIWAPYEPISLFCDFIRLGNTIQMHVPDRVLRQYGYMQTISAQKKKINKYYKPDECHPVYNY